MPQFRLTVNGQEHTVDTPPNRSLLEVLREDIKLTGTKYGCGEGQCRACSVLIDGRAVTACLTSVKAAAGKQITTIEGLATAGKLHKVQQAFVDEGAMQCGYCTPGMIVQTVALLQSNPKPTREQIVSALDGNLCRCCGYPRILAAVRRAVDGGAA